VEKRKPGKEKRASLLHTYFIHNIHESIIALFEAAAICGNKLLDCCSMTRHPVAHSAYNSY